MSVIADGIQGDIAALLKEVGRDITLRKITQGTYSDTTGEATPTSTDYRARGFVKAYKDYLVNGTTILQRDRQCIMQSKDLKVSPEDQDRIIVGTDVYTIVNVKTYEFLGKTSGWTLQLRK